MALPSSWFEIVLLFSVIQGMALSIALGTRLRSGTPANRVLMWFILSLVLMISNGLPIEGSILTVMKKGMSYIGDAVIFLYGPLLYLYTRKLLEDKTDRKEWRHFLPAIVFFIINIVVQLIGPQNLGELFNSLFFVVVSTFIIIQFYTYIFASGRVILRYKSEIGKELSYTPSINYLLTIIGFVGFCLTLFLIDFLGDFIGLDLTILNYEVMWVSISLLTFILAYYAIIAPEVFRISHKVVSKKFDDVTELDQIKKVLLDTMVTDKLYLNEELSLSGVASALGLRKELVSKVINQSLAKNFYRFINEYRIEEFKRLAEQEDSKHITYLGLAYESGFKSKTTFNKAFKEIEGMTPSQYLKS